LASCEFIFTVFDAFLDLLRQELLACVSAIWNEWYRP